MPRKEAEQRQQRTSYLRYGPHSGCNANPSEASEGSRLRFRRLPLWYSKVDILVAITDLTKLGVVGHEAFIDHGVCC